MRRSVRLGVMLVVCGSAFLAAADSFAQTQDTTDTTDPLRIKASVVVTATRTEAEIDKTPVSTSVVTAQQLEARPVQNLDQQLTLTEGVYVQRFQGFSSVDASLARFWTHVQARLRAVGSTANIDVWLDEALQQEEIDIASRLDRSRALVRLGPMLGLAGTIIPLGPALQALLTGDVAGMVDHLVIGFGAVVCGLMMSGIAYVITLVRERWSRVELKEMENLCELIVRALRSRHSREVEEEAPFESLSTA